MIRTSRLHLAMVVALVVACTGIVGHAQRGRGGATNDPPVPPLNLTPNPRVDKLKQELVADIDSRRVFTQQMVDTIFSFSELGFQEVETQRYVTDILVKEGFEVQRGVAGVPTSWIGKYGSGRPVIALGTDIDGLPTTNQTPGVVTRKELVPGAPGHGEGHNAGQAIVMTAALALKKIMEREKLPGTIVLWPGVAEEALGTKAHFVRGGIFKDVDAVLFTHVGSNLGTSWGDGGGTGMVSVEYNFTGQSSHAAGAPWAGRSALDAVELMDIAWNFKREHLRIQQRSHYVITQRRRSAERRAAGGVGLVLLPRDRLRPHQGALGARRHDGQGRGDDDRARRSTSRVLGSAWPQHGNRPIAQAMQANIAKVGMPQWSEADQQFARAFQRAQGAPERGLATTVSETVSGRESIPDSEKTGGASDDIGDIMWSVPTVTTQLPVEHSRRDRPSLDERGLDGHAGRAQGRHAGREGRSDDGARSPDAPGARDRRARLLRERAAGAEAVQAAPPSGRQAGRVAEQGHDGPVQAGAAEVLLRPDEVQVVPRAARHRVSAADAAGAGDDETAAVIS